MRNVVTFFQLLPKPHQKILGVLSFFVLLLLAFPLDYANASRNAVTLEVNKRYPIVLNPEQSKKQAKRVSLDVSGKPDLVAKPSDTLLSFVPRSYYDYEQEHTVKKGDTLYGRSRKYGTSVSASKTANGISGTMIRDGQSLKIPR